MAHPSRTTNSLCNWLAVCACVAAAGALPNALADDTSWAGDIGGTGPGSAVLYEHNDVAPFAGWVNVEATNTGTEAWGDFHFSIYDPIGGQDISNVSFLDAGMGGFDPTSSQSPLSWVIDNVTVGATIDLYYYSDPVLPGQTATFSVYTDNPDQLSFFGVAFYPTPVPEPASLLSLGLVGMLIGRRR